MLTELTEKQPKHKPGQRENFSDRNQGFCLEEDEWEHDDNCKIHEVQKTTYFVFKRFKMTQE